MGLPPRVVPSVVPSDAEGLSGGIVGMARFVVFAWKSTEVLKSNPGCTRISGVNSCLRSHEKFSRLCFHVDGNVLLALSL